MNDKALLKSIFSDLLEDLNPAALVRNAVRIDGGEMHIGDARYTLPKNGKILLAGSGKASAAMAQGMLELLDSRIDAGLIVTPYEYDFAHAGVEHHRSTHPYPSELSLQAAQKLTGLLASATEEDLVVYLLSGGNSALVESPLPPVDLASMRACTEALLRCGASIDEINVVRKHLSGVKGGRLAHFSKAPIVVLVLSDVVGDDLQSIGSAPLYFDESTFEDAKAIFKKYALAPRLDPAVVSLIDRGARGEIPDTPDVAPAHVRHHLIGSNRMVLEQARSRLLEAGYPAQIMPETLEGDADETARRLVDDAVRTPGPLCRLYGGETTVIVRGGGRGGRNQQFALSALGAIEAREGITVLSAATDGIDGNSAAAGAVADAATFRTAQTLGLSIADYLADNNANCFFNRCGDLILSGPTHNNLLDLVIICTKGDM